MAKQKTVVKCEGRFSSLREYLFQEVVPVVLEERTTVTEKDLNDIWFFMEDELYTHDHPTDPYFNSRTDVLRTSPRLDCLSLFVAVDVEEEERCLLEEVRLSCFEPLECLDVLLDAVPPRELRPWPLFFE